jgi:hypothetical protein
MVGRLARVSKGHPLTSGRSKGRRRAKHSMAPGLSWDRFERFQLVVSTMVPAATVCWAIVCTGSGHSEAGHPSFTEGCWAPMRRSGTLVV